MKGKGAAARTSTITPASVSTTLQSFSPATGDAKTSAFYAHLLRAPDAHTLRVYEISTGKCVSRWASNAGADGKDDHRVGSLAWTLLPGAAVAAAAGASDGAEASAKRGKKRRKSDPEAPAMEEESSAKASAPKLVLALGLEDGSIILRSPLDDTSSVTLSNPSSTSPVTALAPPVGAVGSTSHLWSAHADGSVRVWDLSTHQLVGKATSLAEGTRWDDLAVRYLPLSAEGKKQRVQLLLSHLAVQLYSLSLSSSKKDKVRELKATEIGRCVGHVDKGFVRWTGASTLSGPRPEEAMDDSDDDESDSPSALTFLSYSPADRFVQIWSLTLIPDSRVDASLVARLALDSGVQSIALGASILDEDEQVLAAVDTSGKVVLARLPSDIPVVKSTPGKKGKGSGIVALEAETEVVARGGAGAGVVQATLGANNALVLCRSAVKPSFDVVAFADEAGVWTSKVELEKGSAGLLNGSIEEGAPSLPTRYAEPLASTVRSGDAVATNGAASDDEEELVNTGELDVDMAEPTLADRLKALNVTKASAGADVDDAAFDGEDGEEEDEEEALAASGPSVPATTLTTTLIQALHSSDAPLLESCLAHTSAPLIRSTVKRLPSGSLVLNLLESLVERLGKGKKGVPGAASVQRARGLIEWVRQVLIVHVGFLVTIPSLVTRLSALHASLTSRLALQPTLLALNGRLELVMSQIELRQERTSARASAVPETRAVTGSQYVEGESDSEDEDEAVQGAGESDDEGSVEDVVLGSGSEEDDDLSGSEDDMEDLDEDDFSGDDFSGEEDELLKKVGGRKRDKLAMVDIEALEASEGSEEEEGSDEEESDNESGDDESE